MPHTLRLFGREVTIWVCTGVLCVGMIQAARFDEQHNHQEDRNPSEVSFASWSVPSPSGTASFSGAMIRFKTGPSEKS